MDMKASCELNRKSVSLKTANENLVACFCEGKQNETGSRMRFSIKEMKRQSLLEYMRIWRRFSNSASNENFFRKRFPFPTSSGEQAFAMFSAFSFPSG